MDLAELERVAAARLPRDVYDYFAGGADDEETLAANVAAWRRIALRPRVLRDVSKLDLSTIVVGTELSMPVMVAPLAYQRLAHDQGERATAQAAAAAGVAMVVSTMATVGLEDVAEAGGAGPRWFQLYVHRDRGLTAELVRRASAAGYRAVVLTVDLPVLGHRRRDERNRFTLPAGMSMANLGRAVPRVEGSGPAAYAAAELDPAVTFADVEWLAGLSALPVVVKGVLRGDDAAASADAGAAGVIVSNHGGRQLDTALATADALLDVVEAVHGRAHVLVDGGIRRGTDVVKALALGASAVLVGRPVLWGLAVGGEAGVREVLEGFRIEIERACALCGVTSVSEATFDLLA